MRRISSIGLSLLAFFAFLLLACNSSSPSTPITPIPPSITTQPTNQSVTAPAAATFSVVAAGDAPLSYQWRKNGVDITTANSTTFTTPPTSGADNGAQFTVRVSNGVGNVVSSTAVLSVTVPPVPDFSFTAAATSINAGSSGTSTLTVSRTNGHTSAITFSLQANSQGVTGSGAIGVSGTTGSFNLTVPSSVSAGTYALTASGTDGTLTHAAVFNLTVSPTPTPDFSFTVAAASITAGNGGASTISVNRTNGHTAAITLSVQTNPQSVTGSGTIPSSSTTGSLSLTVPGSATPGIYNLTVSGADGTLTRTASLSLTVAAAPVPDFSFTASSTSINAGTSGTSAINLNRVNGHAPAITLSVVSNLQGVTGSGAIAASGTTGSLTLIVPPSATAGIYALNVSGTDGTLTHTAPLSLTVTTAPTPDFSFVAEDANLTAGHSGITAIQVTRSNGHTAAITLSVQTNGQAITGSGTIPDSATTGNLNLSVPALTAPGSYGLTLSGTDGTLVRTCSLYVSVAAELPKIRLFTMSWGDSILRVTDDVLNIGLNATPKTITGSNTKLTDFGGSNEDTVAVDRPRNMLYVLLSNAVLVWHNADTVSGNVAPDRVITIASGVSFSGIAVDSANDRLYFGGFQGGARLFAFSSASTLNGVVAPTAIISTDVSWMALDPVNNRLYMTQTTGPVVTVFDGASTLTNVSAPSRVITFTGFDVRKMAVDPVNNRLYMACRSPSPGGFDIFGFANASSLNGTIADPDATSAFRYAYNSAINVMLDNGDRLYFWADSPQFVNIFYNASALSGTITRQPDKIVYGVVHSGYGLDYQNY